MKPLWMTLLCAALLLGCRQPAGEAPEPLEIPSIPTPAVAEGPDAPTVAPALASVDLMTEEGATQFGAVWRYHDVAIRPAQFLPAGPDGQPRLGRTQTHEIEPAAGWAFYDDADWPVIEPESLSERRTGGRTSFNWYRTVLTVPEAIGGFDPTGTTMVLEVSVDDYAEIWVDGELARRFGQRGGSVISGWNAPNRLIVGRDVKAGQEILLAVFGINGPISQPPTNYVYIRRAIIDFVEGPREPVAVEPQEVNVVVLRTSPAVDEIVPLNPKLFKLAEGFTFTEGPVWVEDTLLFSDPNENRIYRYSASGELSVFRENSGYGGADVDRYTQPGSNGNTVSPSGLLTTCEHGNRRVTRTEADGSVTVLASEYRGKRLNSPNDLVYKSDGSLYFTDPPFGLPAFYDDPAKELDFTGVFRVADGEVELLSKDLKGPNGIAFSPDERFLYVSNWDPDRKIIMRYPVLDDGRLGPGREFFDMGDAPEEEALDGLKVDVRGNVYASGPGGLWIVSPAGKHLGTIVGPRPIHNFAWGGPDDKTLYLTARTTLYRMPLLVAGVTP